VTFSILIQTTCETGGRPPARRTATAGFVIQTQGQQGHEQLTPEALVATVMPDEERDHDDPEPSQVVDRCSRLVRIRQDDQDQRHLMRRRRREKAIQSRASANIAEGPGAAWNISGSGKGGSQTLSSRQTRYLLIP
jgi:hypothetical protein